MGDRCSHNTQAALNLKLLPPIYPSRIMSSSSSSSKGMLKNSRYRAVAKVAKPSSNPETELHDSDEGAVQNPTLENIEESASSDKKGETGEITTSESENHSRSADQGMKKGFARSNLYEICAANHWKPPVFECCKKEGPIHRTMFTFKVTVEIEDASVDIIECYGAPCRKKKIAADHAAEGALWYLKHMGYGKKNK